MLSFASTPSTGCDALCVQELGDPPPDDRVHAAAALCTCNMCTFSCCGLRVWAFVGLLCLLQGCIALEFVLV